MKLKGEEKRWIIKTIIAGSRSITNYPTIQTLLSNYLFTHPPISEVVSGGATGVDKLGERWARENEVEVKLFPAEWDRFGKGAGSIRNIEMASYGDRLIAIWDGSSKGTFHMINCMKSLKKDVEVYQI